MVVKHCVGFGYAHFNNEMYISQTPKFIHQHCFHSDSITSNYNIEAIPTKHKIAIPLFCFSIA